MYTHTPPILSKRTHTLSGVERRATAHMFFIKFERSARQTRARLLAFLFVPFVVPPFLYPDRSCCLGSEGFAPQDDRTKTYRTSALAYQKTMSISIKNFKSSTQPPLMSRDIDVLACRVGHFLYVLGAYGQGTLGFGSVFSRRVVYVAIAHAFAVVTFECALRFVACARKVEFEYFANVVCFGCTVHKHKSNQKVNDSEAVSQSVVRCVCTSGIVRKCTPVARRVRMWLSATS